MVVRCFLLNIMIENGFKIISNLIIYATQNPEDYS